MLNYMRITNFPTMGENKSVQAVARIFLVDDHPLLRQGLKAVLDQQADLQVVGEAANGTEAIGQMEADQVDLVIMDYHLKAELGPDAIQRIRALFPEIYFLALSSYDEKEIIQKMVKAGAISFVLKDAEQSELLAAVRATSQGKSWFSSEISQILLQDLLPNAGNKHADKTFVCTPEELTRREIEVLKLIAAEHTNREIAELLFISAKTVDNHRSNLLQKIGARNTAGLVKFALHYDLV